jgi:16S rRNA (uracil1498-N3)-methyltransferase
MHFFIKPENIEKDTITFSKEDGKYLRNVLRYRNGDSVKILDNRGGEYLAEIYEMSKDGIKARIVERGFSKDPFVLPVIIGQAIPKGSKMDLVVQKATELGVDSLVPLLTERTVVRVDRGSSKRRLERWEKIAKSSSQQSRRNTIPKIHDIMGLEQFFVQYEDAGTKLILWEEEKNVRLRERLKSLEKRKRLVLAIGPEGGFSAREIEMARKAGFLSVGLGSMILRTETVSLVTLGIVQYLLGNLG